METTTTIKQLVIDEKKLIELVNNCIIAGVRYGLGSKCPESKINITNPIPFKKIDCSGFVRWLFKNCMTFNNLPVIVPDGSWNIAAWAERNKFKKSTTQSALLKDGIVRLAYWKNESEDGVSHIALVLNGKTIESHGSKGPNRRKWSLDSNWMKNSQVYALELDTDGKELE